MIVGGFLDPHKSSLIEMKLLVSLNSMHNVNYTFWIFKVSTGCVDDEDFQFQLVHPKVDFLGHGLIFPQQGLWEKSDLKLSETLKIS